MIKLVKNYKLSLYFQTSGVILPRKYSLIKVFEKRFLYNRGDLRAHFGAPQGTRTLEPLTNTSFNRANICQTSSSYNITKAIQTKNAFSLRYVEGVEPITVVESTEEKGDLEYQKRGSGIPLYEEEELPASNSYSNPSPRSEFLSSRVNPCPVWRKYPLTQ